MMPHLRHPESLREGHGIYLRKVVSVPWNDNFTFDLEGTTRMGENAREVSRRGEPVWWFERPAATRMLGSWQATAVRTPFGRLPYNLEFRELTGRPCTLGCSVSQKTAGSPWTFTPRSETTMRAVYIYAMREDSHRGLKFSRGHPNFLEVWIRHAAEQGQEIWQAEIGLRGAPHVRVAARRSRAR